MDIALYNATSSTSQKKTVQKSHLQAIPKNILENLPNDTVCALCKKISINLVDTDSSASSINNILVNAFFKEKLTNSFVIQNQNLVFTLGHKVMKFEIVNIVAKEDIENLNGEKIAYLFTKDTTISIVEPLQPHKAATKEAFQTPFAGTEEILQRMKDIIETSLFKSLAFTSKGFHSIKGILLFGPSGVGKTLLLKKLQSHFQEVNFINVDLKLLLSKFVGDSEKKLSEFFNLAKNNTPSIIVFDDLHAISSKVDDQNSLEHTFITELDNLIPEVLVIGCTNNLGQIDQSLRRAGRLDKEVKMEIPAKEEREEILNAYLERLSHDLSEKEIRSISSSLNGFTGADISSLIREAIINSCLQKEETIKITKSMLDEAISQIQPSGLKDLIMEIPKVQWGDIGGYTSIKHEVERVVEWPFKHPEAFTRMGISPSKGILLYGPPGCCKTMIAKAIATESNLNFIAIRGPELFSKYVGDSEKAVREIFRRARLCSPSVIFFDEIDAMATKRASGNDVTERVITQMLTEMDGMESLTNVIVVAATNRPHDLDKALIRPGRFDHLVYVPLPSAESREEILKINLSKMATKDISNSKLIKETEGYSGAEICLLCREAGLIALSSDINCEAVTMEHFESALEKVKPRINEEVLESYRKFALSQKIS